MQTQTREQYGHSGDFGAEYVADLQHLIANKDAVYAALGNQLSSLQTAWRSANAPEYEAVVRDWNTLSARYHAARDAAQKALDNRMFKNPVADAVNDFSTSFQSVLMADEPGGTTVTPGGLSGVSARVEAGRVKYTPSVAAVPVNMPFQIQQDMGSAFLANTVLPGKAGEVVAGAIGDTAHALRHPIDTMMGPPDPNKKPSEGMSTMAKIGIAACVVAGLAVAVKIAKV